MNPAVATIDPSTEQSDLRPSELRARKGLLSTVPGRRRLSREESQKQARARLIAVGREHFLTFGLGGAKADRIAEEAG